MVRAFIAGMAIGGTLVVLYQHKLRRYIDERTRAVRMRAARGLAAGAEGLEAARAMIEAGLGEGGDAGEEPRRRQGPAGSAGGPERRETR